MSNSQNLRNDDQRKGLPDKDVSLYRGYFIRFADSNETVELIKPPHGKSDLWQSEQRLEEKLREVLDSAKKLETMPYDVGVYIEEVKVRRACE